MGHVKGDAQNDRGYIYHWSNLKKALSRMLQLSLSHTITLEGFHLGPFFHILQASSSRSCMKGPVIKSITVHWSTHQIKSQSRYSHLVTLSSLETIKTTLIFQKCFTQIKFLMHLEIIFMSYHWLIVSLNYSYI